MKKMLTKTLVLSVVEVMVLALASGTPAFGEVSPRGGQAGIILPPASSQTPAVTVFCISDKGHSTYIVFVPTGSSGHPLVTSAQVLSCLSINNIIGQDEGNGIQYSSLFNALPEPQTIGALGLAGLMAGRRRKRQAAFRDLPLCI
ncbi:MAG: PEP-CTERM sorting domain-containing protein [Sedimentisphaerales bacterium]|nr:PEP-CTERM sorting domain-containing protein [Sedimentisphaerales bacterium]